jgi:hypothetical protein
MVDRSRPTRLELVCVECCPLSYQPGCPTWQAPGQDLSVESDPRRLAGVADVEMRRIVVPKEHQDTDPVELADSWHNVTVRILCDTFDTALLDPRAGSMRCLPNRTYSGAALLTRVNRSRGQSHSIQRSPGCRWGLPST